MRFESTPSYKKAYKRLSAQDKNRVDKALETLASNPLHPGIHTEKVGKEIWSVRVSDKLRLTFGWSGDAANMKEADPIFLRNVGYHQEVYRSP